MVCLPYGNYRHPGGDVETFGGHMMVVDQCVRLGMAIVIIALVSLALYQFSSRSHAEGVTSVPAISARD